jgi:putative transposase
MSSKKKKKNTNIKKYTITSNHAFSKNISKILDELGKTSKNTFNHYLFCHKYYLLYKDIVYQQVFLDTIQKKNVNKELIDNLIHIGFKSLYEQYQNDYKNYISNNNILYSHIKTLNLNITHTNFINIYNELVIKCLSIDKLVLSNSNLIFLYEQNILSILVSFYYFKYYNVKNGLINKIPIKVQFDDNFKEHVMTTEKPINFIQKKQDYKELLNNILSIEKDLFIKRSKDKITDEEKKELDNQYKLGSEQNFISRLVYSTMKFNKTSSDLIVNILPKAHETISSYYALKNKGLKANKPKYITNDFYSIIFCGKTIKLEDKNINQKQIRLLYGDYIIKNWFNLFGKELSKNEKNNLFLKIIKPTLLMKEGVKLKQIEIKKVANNTYKIHYKFDVPKQVNKLENVDKVKIKETISIDLGMKNLFTIHDPNGKQRILKGGCLISINEYYNKKISIIQSLKDKTKEKNKKIEYENEIKLLNDMRLRKLNGMINNIIQKMQELYSEKKLIVFGYNEGWKDKMNLGSNTNRKFYTIPYARIIKKLKYALEGKTEIKIINEAYTSKCDALGNEDICKHDEYLGKRVKRGLFSSSVKKLINADLNGAINILRKYSEYKYKKIKGLNLQNPEKITL